MASILRQLLDKDVVLALPVWKGESAEQVWRDFLWMVDAGIDDVPLQDIRRLYSKVIAHQVYHQTMAISYRAASHRVQYNMKTLYATTFTDPTVEGSVDYRRQSAISSKDYRDQARTLASYQSTDTYQQGIADGLGIIASFLSRELTARFNELASARRDTDSE